MASSPWNCWSHDSATNPPSPSPSSSVSQSPSDRKSVEEVWKDLKLASLCDCSMDMVAPFNKDSSNAYNLKQAQPTLLSFSTSNTLFDASESSTVRPSSAEKMARQDIHASSDPRHRRMIKNRESAVRSRARQQAYRKGLEMKLARLTEENSRLKRQVEQLKFCLSSDKPPKSGPLHRTTSSPF